MASPFYPTDVDDPDLDWLVSNFLIERPDFLPVETGSLPLMLVPLANIEDEYEDSFEFEPEEAALNEPSAKEEQDA